MTSIRKRAIGAAVSIFALAAAAPALAQDKPEDNGGLADIVVTAQRTSQKLNDVPLSITAATSWPVRASARSATCS